MIVRGPPSGAGAEPSPLYDLIELFFFAYRDFTADADRQLEGLGFGRAHHRVLHFVDRHPGLAVAALLDILRITKQSLNRVMKDLIDGGFIEVRAGVSDRRRRLIHVTPKGGRLAVDLARLHSARFERALSPLPAEVRAQAVEFLLGMIDPGERDRVVELVWGARRPPGGAEAGAGWTAAPREHAA
ncbi:MAG: winged helix-turn-helix transcriptional regulator [Caulobacteraceae bacterium]|nr:winged helix-turn-helix transcriptional regulator [Caulobacter sp.]